MRNIFQDNTTYGGWSIKGIYKLKNCTNNEMYSRLDRKVMITESDRGYGKSACFSIDEGKRAYIPLSTSSYKNCNDYIDLEECCIVVLNKNGEDDIYRVIEIELVPNIDDSKLWIDIFELFEIYDTALKELPGSRELNKTELSHLNTYIPGVVFADQHNLSCKLFAKGSTTQFYVRSVAPGSDVHEGDMFDITKCFLKQYKKDGYSEIKIKIYIPTEAKDLSGIETRAEQEKERQERCRQIDIRQSISRIQSYPNNVFAEINDINKEYQRLCSLIGNKEAEKYKPYVDEAIEKVKEKEAHIKKMKEEKKVKLCKRIEVTVSLGYWIALWIVASILYLTGSKNECTEFLFLTVWFGPAILGISILCIPFKYKLKSNLAGILFALLWAIDIALTIAVYLKK